MEIQNSSKVIAFESLEFNEATRSSDGMLAAIDLGSNTCRLLVARPNGTNYKIVESFSRVIQLGAGLRTHRVLSEEAMQRAVKALKECVYRLKKYNILHLRCVATEACRQAQNQREFLALVKQETGLTLEIISEFEEAHLALKGCMGLIDSKIPYIIAFDIGGCSTEVMWAQINTNQTLHVLDWLSLPFGVVNVIEACGGDAVGFYNDIRERIRNEVAHLNQNKEILEGIHKDQVQMIGSSGTTTTIAAMYLNLSYYDRGQVDGSYLPINFVHEISLKLRDMPPRERANHPCIGLGRGDLVLGGTAILEGICDVWPFKNLRVADRGVRDGILSEMIAHQIHFDSKDFSMVNSGAA